MGMTKPEKALSNDGGIVEKLEEEEEEESEVSIFFFASMIVDSRILIFLVCNEIHHYKVFL